MLNLSKSGNAIYVLYAAKNFISGKTITIDVRNGADSLTVTGGTVPEIGSTGLYGTTFTPATTGDFKVLIYETGSKVAAASVKVTAYDIESVGGDVTSIKSLVEGASGLAAIKGVVDANATKLTDIQGAGFATGTDSLKQIKDYLVNTIQSSISGIQNSTLTAVSLPQQLEQPETGTTSFKVYVNTYTSAGASVNADSDNITVLITNEAGAARDTNILTASIVGPAQVAYVSGQRYLKKESTGRYSFVYQVSSAHALEALNFDFNYTVSSVTRNVDRSATVVDDLPDLSQISTDTAATQAAVANVTYGLSALKTLIDTFSARFDNGGDVEVRFDTIEGYVDQVEGYLTNGTFGLSALKTLIDAITTTLGTVNTNVGLIKAKTDLIGTAADITTDPTIFGKIERVYQSVLAGGASGGYIG